jgi:spoIIIJ-associated protein
MPEIEFKGKTVVEAINNGLSELKCSKDDIIIKIVSEGSAGLFGLMGAKPAVILISFIETEILTE